MESGTGISPCGTIGNYRKKWEDRPIKLYNRFAKFLLTIPFKAVTRVQIPLGTPTECRIKIGSPQDRVLILCAKSSQRTESDRNNGISRKPATSGFSTINGETFATSSGSNHWPSATLNQRAVGSTPTRPTKFFVLPHFISGQFVEHYKLSFLQRIQLASSLHFLRDI
jgi:hypothetical protein